MILRKAFTLLELIVVISIIAIISISLMTTNDSLSLLTLRDQIIKDIRYTQSQALFDDKFDLRSAYWFKSFWHIEFSNDSYQVFSDQEPFNGQAEENEIALDSLTRQPLINKFDTNQHIDVNTSQWTNNIYFDQMGRPYFDINTTRYHPMHFLVRETFQLKVYNSQDNLCITIEPSGYIYNDICKF
jgi:prepilin-type N-terminal cleavage/methylation domain-containing protein